MAAQNQNIGLRREELSRLAAHGRPSTQTLCELIVLYTKYKIGKAVVQTIADVERAWDSDCSTLFSLLAPDFMGLQRGFVEISDQGIMDFSPDDKGPHRFATQKLPADLRDDLMKRLLA